MAFAPCVSMLGANQASKHGALSCLEYAVIIAVINGRGGGTTSSEWNSAVSALQREVDILTESDRCFDLVIAHLPTRGTQDHFIEIDLSSGEFFLPLPDEVLIRKYGADRLGAAEYLALAEGRVCQTSFVYLALDASPSLTVEYLDGEGAITDTQNELKSQGVHVEVAEFDDEAPENWLRLGISRWRATCPEI